MFTDIYAGACLHTYIFPGKKLTDFTSCLLDSRVILFLFIKS